MNDEFLPVLLGTDANVYGMARSFYEEYGVTSLAVGCGDFMDTRYSNIVKVITVPDLLKEDNFCNYLINLAKEKLTSYKKLILISCGDNYTSLVVDNKKKLQKYFIVPYIDKKMKDLLENKTTFYKICDKYGIDYPKTYVCEYGIDDVPSNIKFPVAVKAANSIAYSSCNFSKKKKGYKANTIEELNKIITAMRDGNYKDDIIIQDFVPGDDSCMYVLNSYSDANGKVRMMCLGNCILEDYTPGGIGNYNAIISTYNKKIYDNFQLFLEEIGFVGYSNFDIKYDCRDKKYKVFEINIRQGRSSYFTTAAGCNLARYLVRDYIFGENKKTIYNKNDFLWLAVPKCVLKKYVNRDSLKKARQLIRQNKYSYTLLYKDDFNIKRYINIKLLYMKKIIHYKKYYNKRRIDE